MKLSFSIDEFLAVFERYNLAVWPTQAFHFLLAVVAVFLVIKKESLSMRIVFSILSFFWIWMGVVYHILFFSSINPAAWLFGFAFIAQGFLFLFVGVIKQRIGLRMERGWIDILGNILIVYSLIVYPILGFTQGHTYPKSPAFGLPCPTTIFTFGLLVFSVKRLPWYVFLIPLLWSLVGFSAASNLQIIEDYGLVLAGLLFVTVQLFTKPEERSEPKSDGGEVKLYGNKR